MARQSWVAVWVVMLGLCAGLSGCGGSTDTPDDMGSGDGASGRCDVAADCPQSACTEVACVASSCVITALPDGPAPQSAQTAGDCQQVSCSAGAVA